MIISVMHIVIQVLIVFAILVGMVLLLLAINRLSNHKEFDDPEETAELKHDLHHKIDVISNSSVFHKFLARHKRGGGC